jgi:hypothetical protein
MSIDDLAENNYHKGTHDTIVKSVVNRLEDSGLYDCIKHNVHYRLRKSHQDGEADVLAVSGDRAFAFEVKSSPKHLGKAVYQLCKDERLLNREARGLNVYKFLVYKNKSQELVYRRIK